MARIVVIGSVSVDEIVVLAEPLREGAHLEGEGRGCRLGGGAANTGAALAHAGHEVAIVGVVGDDDAGGWILGELSALGIDISAIVRVPGRSTRSIILVDGAGERTVVNLGRALEAAAPLRLFELPADAVYVRSRSEGIADLLAAKAETVLTIAHVPPLGTLCRPAHVIVTSASDVGPDILAAPFAAGRRIAGPGLQWIVVTKGEHGASAHSANRDLEKIPPAVVPVDTTGAGDAFAAGLVHGLVSGMDMAKILETANAWGAESTRYAASSLPREAAVFAGLAKSTVV